MKYKLFTLFLALAASLGTIYAEVLFVETFSTRRGSTVVDNVNEGGVPSAAQWFSGYTGVNGKVSGNQYDNDYISVTCNEGMIDSREMKDEDDASVGLSLYLKPKYYAKFEGALPKVEKGAYLCLIIAGNGDLETFFVKVNKKTLTIPNTTLDGKYYKTKVNIPLEEGSIDSIYFGCNNTSENSKNILITTFGIATDSASTANIGYLDKGNKGVQIGDLYYILNTQEKTAEVTYHNNDNKQHYYENYSGLTTANIPDSVVYNGETFIVTGIGDSAFYNCQDLKSITIPKSITYVGINAFTKYNSYGNYCGIDTIVWNAKNCDDLYSAPFPSQYDVQGNKYSYVQSFTFGDEVEVIPAYLCSELKNLKTITIPNSVTSIGSFAFSDCSISELTIPSGVQYIGIHAFCVSVLTMESTTPPVFLDNYGEAPLECGSTAYVPCGSLETYQQAEGWSSISNLGYAPSQYTITTKDTDDGRIETLLNPTICDETIQVRAEASCGSYFVKWADGNTENPRTIELTQDTTMEAIFAVYTEGACGENLTWKLEGQTLEIQGEGAMWNYFDSCRTQWWLSHHYEITSIKLPKDLTTIGDVAFNGCYNLHEVVVSNKVTTIGKYAFASCSLKNITLGTSVKVIEGGAFTYNCIFDTSGGKDVRPKEDSDGNPICSIETITCYSQRPPTINSYDGVNAFPNLPYRTIIYVPADYLNNYIIHDFWGLYDVRPLGATSTETTEVKVVPSENTADVVWPAVSGAATYELVIKDKDGNIICTLIFNANGQLTSIAFTPARDNSPQQTQTTGFSFTVTGLNAGTNYDLTITAKDNNGGILDTKTVSFTTTGEPQGIEEPNPDPSLKGGGLKVLRDGQIYIIRGDKTYTLTGVEVK